MLDKPISPLRRRMIDEHDGAPVQGEGAERLRPARQGPSRPFSAVRRTRPRARIFADINCIWPSSRSAQGPSTPPIAALRFFFTVTLERPDLVRPLTTVNKPRKAPVVLSGEEVARFSSKPRRASSTSRAQRRLRRGPAGVRGREPQGV